MKAMVNEERIKELEAQIELANKIMEAEDELGCGFTPESYFNEMNEIVGKMYDELATLKGYTSYEEMEEAEYSLYPYMEDEEIPF